MVIFGYLNYQSAKSEDAICQLKITLREKNMTVGQRTGMDQLDIISAVNLCSYLSFQDV